MSEQINRARWAQSSPNTLILKCCRKDGGAVVAAIEEINTFRWHWSAGANIGFAQTRYAAMRRVRKALAI